ncbi:transposase, partial [Anaeromicropila populeti]
SHVPVSANTVLRILKKENIIIDYNAENIGINNFAFLKRNVYYSVIVDNDTHKRLGVVASRQQPEVIKALGQFQNVKTVTRDFSKSYRAAIQKALPHAKQIVDRFHILKILTEHIGEYLKRTEGHNNKIKLIKRQMYGRCNFNLLRLKILA